MRAAVVLLTVLIMGGSYNVAALNVDKMPKPPCGIKREAFYSEDIILTSKNCWSDDYIPCAKTCADLKNLLRYYWNSESKCDIIKQLAYAIPQDRMNDAISPKQIAFPNRQDCGLNNGNWKNKDGKFDSIRRTENIVK